jgi:hypothetical protein
MELKEAQDECTRRYGEYGIAMIDGCLRHEVGFFDGDNVAQCGFVRTGEGGTFEDAFADADSNEARLIALFYPKATDGH